MIFLSQSFLLDLFLSRLLVSYKKILSTFFTRLIRFVSFSWLSFRFRFFCLHAFLSFRINLFKLAFFLNMKIIFAFRTRLSFLSKEKTLYTICYAVVNLLSRTTQSYLRQQPLSLRAFCASLGTLGPAFRSASSRAASSIYFFQNKSLVGSNGLGPSTSRLSGVCSNQLSYEPLLVEVIGFEPMTPCLQGRCSTN